jgi:hypothetical protein
MKLEEKNQEYFWKNVKHFYWDETGGKCGVGE